MLNRRTLMLSLPLFLSGCAGIRGAEQSSVELPISHISPFYQKLYTSIETDKFPIEAVDLSQIDPAYYRQEVSYPSDEQPGTIIIDTANFYLYLLQENDRAMRYGIGVGKEGLEFTGRAVVQHKREWPRWTPTPDMIRREPKRYAKWAGGMIGGPKNPLGARALYLFRNGRDTLFRIHGTSEPWSIGQAVSSGCIRLLNQDIIDLYNRTPSTTRVVVLAPRQA